MSEPTFEENTSTSAYKNAKLKDCKACLNRTEEREMDKHLTNLVIINS